MGKRDNKLREIAKIWLRKKKKKQVNFNALALKRVHSQLKKIVPLQS